VSKTLANQLVQVSQDYLGPAAERFLDRQISTHTNKRPDDVNEKDIEELIDWIRLSFALLTRDTNLVDEYVERLKLIAQGRGKEALSKEWSQS
jgi:hypothetical protein